MPFCAVYMENDMPLSICWGIRNGEEYMLSSEKGTEYKLLEKSVTDMETVVKWKCSLRNGYEAVETLVMKDCGIHLHFEGAGDICCLLPALVYDGKKDTQVEVNDNCLSIDYCGWQCRYTVTGTMRDTEKVYANRNGHYRAFAVEGENRIGVTITIEKLV